MVVNDGDGGWAMPGEVVGDKSECWVVEVLCYIKLTQMEHPMFCHGSLVHGVPQQAE